MESKRVLTGDMHGHHVWLSVREHDVDNYHWIEIEVMHEAQSYHPLEEWSALTEDGKKDKIIEDLKLLGIRNVKWQSI